MAKGQEPANKISDEKIVELLEPYLILGYSVKKACDLSGAIDHSTVYLRLDKESKEEERTGFPGNLTRKIRSLKGSVNVKARENIANKISKGDVDSSKWWLERVEKDTFSTKVETELGGNVSIQIVSNLDTDDPKETKNGRSRKKD